mmetsp:Transcript_80290/g.173598  ORF Transcript_80290/g.173598 Transcript_80290/m.173598 type:complete len:402 (-) Transcript_80290:819-2024(-)
MADNSTTIQQRMADNSTSIQQHAPSIKWATWQLLWARRKWPAALVGSAHVHGAAWQHAAATWPQCCHLRGITSAAQHAPNAANVGRSGAGSSGDGESRGRVGGVLGTGTAWRRPHAAWHRRPTDERVGPTGQLRAPDALGAGSASAAGLAAARRRGEPHGQGHGEPGRGGPAALRRGRDRRAVRHDRRQAAAPGGAGGLARGAAPGRGRQRRPASETRLPRSDHPPVLWGRRRVGGAPHPPRRAALGHRRPDGEPGEGLDQELFRHQAADHRPEVPHRELQRQVVPRHHRRLGHELLGPEVLGPRDGGAVQARAHRVVRPAPVQGRGDRLAPGPGVRRRPVAHHHQPVERALHVPRAHGGRGGGLDQGDQQRDRREHPDAPETRVRGQVACSGHAHARRSA